MEPRGTYADGRMARTRGALRRWGLAALAAAVAGCSDPARPAIYRMNDEDVVFPEAASRPDAGAQNRRDAGGYRNQILGDWFTYTGTCREAHTFMADGVYLVAGDRGERLRGR